jgi:hypothetical protein
MRGNGVSFGGAHAGKLQGTAMLWNDDTITTHPTISTHYGRAWEVDVDACCERRGIERAADGTVALWLIEAPWAHPVWHSYSLTLVHLRPMADNRATKFYVEGATHEMWVYALDPDQPRQLMIDTGKMRWLTPGNFAAQMIEPNDADAASRIRSTVRMICDGSLSPDTDFIRTWVTLFGDNMMRDRATRH